MKVLDEIDQRLCVVYVDGGICSQIAFVAFGLYAQKMLGERARVTFDLTWYDRFGVDLQGRQVRKWDFEKAFPDFRIEVATEAELAAVGRGLTVRDVARVADVPLPVHLVGYPLEMRPNVGPGCRLLRPYFHPTLDEKSRQGVLRIDGCVSCGVHFRRGDLSNGGECYGSPTSVEYYLTALEIIHGFAPEATFFFFSDEMDWVRSAVLPRLPGWCRYEIMEENGSDRGYIDLYLLTRCDYLISSIGSFGQFAALLSDKVKWLVLSRRREEILDSFEHCIYINDDRESERARHVKALQRGLPPERKIRLCDRVAYVIHRCGAWIRFRCGRDDAGAYPWQVLRLRRRYLGA